MFTQKLAERKKINDVKEQLERKQERKNMWMLRLSKRPKYWLRIPSTFKLLSLFIIISFCYTDDIYQPKVAKHIHTAKKVAVKSIYTTSKIMGTFLSFAVGGGR